MRYAPRPVVYLSAAEVEELNRMVLRMAGRAQSALLRERATLESAVVRPQNAAFYEGADLVTQAALYMVGIAFNHPFIDGNKRTGFLAGVTFLHVNGFEIEVG